jgi:broad specificity phosphatase PhoE
VIAWPQTLVLVRHGESLGNIANANAYSAGADRLDIAVNDPSVELSDLGVRQAQALGARLAQLSAGERPTLVLESSYVRARQTTDHVIKAAGLGDVERVTDERLRDREQGILDRLTGVGVRAEFPDEAERRDYLGKFWYRPPGGESWADVAQRIRAVLRDVPILLTRYVIERMTTDEVTSLSRQIVNCGMTTYHRGSDGLLVLSSYNDATPVVEDESAEATAHE